MADERHKVNDASNDDDVDDITPAEDEAPKDDTDTRSGADDDDAEAGEKALTQKEKDKLAGKIREEERRKARKEIEKEVAAEKARMAREAKEAKLLEEQNYKELLELREKEAADAKAKLEEYERQQKVERLLTKEGVTDERERALFAALPGDLESIAETLAGWKELRDELVADAVNKSLGSSPPPKSPKENQGPQSLQAQIAAAEKAGDWELSMNLKNKWLEHLGKVPAGA